MWKGLLLLEKDSTNNRLFLPSHLPSDKAACNKMTQQGTPSQGFRVAISLWSTLLQCFCHKSLARHTVLAIGRYSKGEHDTEQPGHSSCRAQGTQHSYMCDKVDNHCALEAQSSKYTTEHGDFFWVLTSIREIHLTVDIILLLGGQMDTWHHNDWPVSLLKSLSNYVQQNSLKKKGRREVTKILQPLSTS